MNIDRSRFLLLTGVLAATGAVAVACTSTTPDASDAGTGANPDAGDATTDAGADAANDAAGDRANDTAADTANEAATDAAPDSPACAADDGGAALVCADLVDAGTDGGDSCITSGAGQTACDTYVSSFKPGVAKVAVDCLVGLPTCEGGLLADGGAVTCGAQAVAAACPDPTADTFCQPLVAACNPDGGADAGSAFTQASCVALASALSTTGRADFTTCITEGLADNCTSDPGFCLTQYP